MLFAITSATLFGIGTPFAKVLTDELEPIVLAGLLYLGVFAGLSLYSASLGLSGRRHARGAPLAKTDLPWLAGATASGGIIAPICLMTGLTLTTGFTASLLLNLEGLATALIAYLVFRENLGWRLGAAVACMTAAGILLSWDPNTGAVEVSGPLLLLAAGIAWGIDNNLSRQISAKDPVQISKVKGLVAGSVSISMALFLGLAIPTDASLLFALVLGSVSYGASMVLYIQALQGMGASRTGAFFSLGPFFGAVASVVLLNEWLGWTMLPAALLMLAGVLAIVYERHSHMHVHEESTHAHVHSHDDATHEHSHGEQVRGRHMHEHTHRHMAHDHVHWPDIHHRHGHEDDVREKG